jgi:integrase
MRKTVLRLRKTAIRGETRWELTIPRQGGGRSRRYFDEEKKAKTALEQAQIQQTNFGLAALSISERLRIEATEAERLLTPYKVSLLSAVQDYISRRKAAEKSRNVKDVVKAFIESARSDGRSHRYLLDLSSRLGRFSQRFGNYKLTEITTEQIDGWLKSLGIGAVTRNSYRRRLHSLFAFGIGRKWCLENPIVHVAKAKEKPEPIGILTPEQVSALLTSASEGTLGYWAIGAFAGLRSAELERLEWKDIHFDSGLIEVPAFKAKTAQRRFVEIQPNLMEWLTPYHGHKGKIAPIGLRKRLEADRIAAGIQNWHTNALRHSFASYHLARFQNASKTALELGHTSQAIVFAHYRELVRPKTAETYWSIRPQAGEKLVAIA